MALIGKIRSYSWLLLAFIGIAMVAFIMGDFVRKSPKQSVEDIGIVAGESISPRDFDARVQVELDRYKKQSKQEKIDQNTTNQIREQVWSQIVREIIMKKELDELGLVVTSAELLDLMTGKEPHQYILQNFADPKTGMFNPNDVKNFLKTLDQQPPENREMWYDLEKAIKEEQINNKYTTLVSKGLYVTKSQAKINYELRNTMIDFRYVTIKYNTVSDSSLKVTQEELQKYYEQHKWEYDQEASRDLEYVSFDVVPSAEDIKKVEDWIKSIIPEMAKTDSISDMENLVNVNADSQYDPRFKKKGDLPICFDTSIFKAELKTIQGPYMDNGAYKIAKLMDRQMRPDSCKAKHILIAWEGALRAEPTVKLTKEQAKTKADSIMGVLKTVPGDTIAFNAFAKKFSADPSNKDNGGNLGWFVDGMMIKAFNEACIKGAKGEMKLVETEFGYHIILILDLTKPIEKVEVGIVDRTVEASEPTIQMMYKKANDFAAIATDAAKFDMALMKQGLIKKTADFVREIDWQLPGMESPRDLVHWMYNEETKKNDVSKVFDVGLKFVVGKLKEVREKGFAPLEQVKPEVETGAKRDKKAQMFIDRINKLGAISDINALGLKLNAPVDTVEGITFSAYGIPKLGPEPEIIGYLFGVKNPGLTKPIKGKAGVAVAIIDKKVNPVPTTDYTMMKKQLNDYLMSRAGSEVFNALMKKADIIDNRGKFY
ncbi:MAG: SurA N-terminal domain-containing protein [Bacteroidota bacterium]